MPITIQRSDNELLVELEGTLRVRDVETMAARISASLDGVTSVRVATAASGDVDTSILQLLCSLRKTVPMFMFEQSSDEFLGAVNRSGLRRELFSARQEVL